MLDDDLAGRWTYEENKILAAKLDIDERQNTLEEDIVIFRRHHHIRL